MPRACTVCPCPSHEHLLLREADAVTRQVAEDLEQQLSWQHTNRTTPVRSSTTSATSRVEKQEAHLSLGTYQGRGVNVPG